MRVEFRVLLIGCVALTGCTSPEATRTRGGGPGADVGNRPARVLMHEGSRPYWDTPELVRGEAPPLGSARHAQQRSTP
jgi:hypothetical protein